MGHRDVGQERDEKTKKRKETVLLKEHKTTGHEGWFVRAKRFAMLRLV